MTSGADLLRDRRRADAAPGGPHERRVRLLFSALPAGVGIVAAVMIITPMFPRGEVSFLLDRNKVAITRERLQVSNATYRGTDDQGRAFSLSAGSAVQHSAAEPLVRMQQMVAHLQLRDGPAQVVAPQGNYDLAAEHVALSGPVRFQAADGYSMVTSSVGIDMRNHRAQGTGGVSGTVPAGTFSASSMALDLSERNVVLQGRAHLRMTPGRMKTPQ